MIRTRIAPSPTGYLHFGLARTALFNYLFAKKNGGEFIVRVEDTDKARSAKEFEDDILDQLSWLGLKPDKLERQSDLVSRHMAATERLIADDRAYISKEPAKDDPTKEVSVIRLRNSGRVVTFSDLLRGDISFDTTELGDMVIARAIDDPLYHLAVVVDDAEMHITHVIRGEDHISNTPRQILIQEALGYERPVYAHIPLILMPDKSKMSKRKHQTALSAFRAQGFLPEALINYLALLGWNPGGENELYTLPELVAAFTLEGVQKSGAVFDVEKLRWFNREYLLRMNDAEFSAYVLAALREELAARSIDTTAHETPLHALLPLIRERIHVLEDLRALIRAGEFDFFFTEPQLDPAKLLYKTQSRMNALQHLTQAASLLHTLDDEAFKRPGNVKKTLWGYAEEAGRGNVLWPLRYALSGRDKSPDPFLIASIVGKSITLVRIAAAARLLQ